MKPRFEAAVILVVLAFGLPTVEPALAQVTILLPGNPLIVTFGNWRFLNGSIQYLEQYPSPQVMILFAIWKNPTGQTVAANTCGVSMTGEETANCYVPIFDVAPGTYNVSLFVIVFPENSPVSLPVTVQVTLWPGM